MPTARAAALTLLEQLGKTRFPFQADAAARCVAAMLRGERLIVQAPTGAGKTLIAFLAVAIAAEQNRRWRGMLVVPSRPLVRQHVVDAAWLRSRVPLQFVTSQDRTDIWSAALASPRGLVCSTPQALYRRVAALGGLDQFDAWDVALFDEIDVFATNDLEERRDLWPLVEECRGHAVPMVGFTGTSLSADQRSFWEDRDFATYEPEVDHDWLPFTRVRFIGVEDDDVIETDRNIRDQLGMAYSRFGRAGGNPQSWKQITTASLIAGELGDAARSILKLHSDRLQLFEGGEDTDGKLAQALAWINGRSALVLCRYVATAVSTARFLASHGIEVVQADGTMRASEVERRAGLFRRGETQVLVITRDLGGRGLDFPAADSALVISPRSNYQTVAQELARIRSRHSAVKECGVLYYSSTTETAKAARLADHLTRRNLYAGQPLFEAIDAPVAPEIGALEGAHLAMEEGLR